MNPIEALRGPWTIAVFTWREGMRKKTLVGFLLLSVLVIIGANFMTSFLNQDTVGAVEVDIDLKLIKDICVTTISIFGVLITIFISASVVPAEVENKVIYSVLSKPVRRLQYLLGKFMGVQLIVMMNLGLMGALFFFAIYVQQNTLPTLMLWSVLLTYFEFLIVSAFTFALSCTSTSSVLPTIGGLFVYIVGNLTEYLKDVQVRADGSDAFGDQVVSKIAYALSNVIPNLQNFSIKMQVVNSLPNDPPRDVLIPNLIVYSLVFSAIGFLISYLIFRRKEM